MARRRSDYLRYDTGWDVDPRGWPLRMVLPVYGLAWRESASGRLSLIAASASEPGRLWRTKALTRTARLRLLSVRRRGQITLSCPARRVAGQHAGVGIRLGLVLCLPAGRRPDR